MPLKVFISSKVRGMEEERDIADEVIKSHKFEVVRCESWAPDPNHNEDVCRRKVRESDVVICMLGKVYSEMTGKEYEEAMNNRKSRILLIENTEERDEQMKNLITEIGEDDRFRRKYDTKEDLKTLIDEALINLVEIKFRNNKERDIIHRAFAQCSYMNDYILDVEAKNELLGVESSELNSTKINLMREKYKIEKILREMN